MRARTEIDIVIFNAEREVRINHLFDAAADDPAVVPLVAIA